MQASTLPGDLRRNAYALLGAGAGALLGVACLSRLAPDQASRLGILLLCAVLLAGALSGAWYASLASVVLGERASLPAPRGLAAKLADPLASPWRRILGERDAQRDALKLRRSLLRLRFLRVKRGVPALRILVCEWVAIVSAPFMARPARSWKMMLLVSSALVGAWKTAAVLVRAVAG